MPSQDLLSYKCDNFCFTILPDSLQNDETKLVQNTKKILFK